MKDEQTTPVGGINCRDSVYFVSLLRDAELPIADEHRLKQHISSCKSCQQAKRQFEIMHAALDLLLARPLVQT
jgi:hypothetical protein